MLANYAVNLGRALAASYWQPGWHNMCGSAYECVCGRTAGGQWMASLGNTSISDSRPVGCGNEDG